MSQRSVLRRTRIVALTLMCGVGSLLVSVSGRAQHAPATVSGLSGSPKVSGVRANGGLVASHGEDAIQRLKQEGTYESLAEAVAATAYSFARVDHAASLDNTAAYEARNPAQALSAHFTGDEVGVRSSGEREWQLGLRLIGWGYGESLAAITSDDIRARGDRIEIRKHALGGPASSPLVEWYVNSPRGLEQGFTLSAPPDATRPHERLRLALELSGDLRGETTGDGKTMLLADRSGRQVARYDHLKAWDAAGREIESRLRVRGREVFLEVNDTEATYPITIDPILTQEVQLEDDEGVAFDEFGSSVAVSGNTAIVAAIGRGAAYIFLRNGPTWALQQKLPEVDAPGESFGQSVAINGDTAIVGATATNGQGAAYVFVRVGTTWSPQGILTASDGAAGDRFGYSVAVSGDTAVVGAPYRNSSRGAAYVFVRNAGTWVQPEQQKLVAIGGEANDGFGWSVAISGETIIVGVFSDNVVGDTLNKEGSAYVFVRNGTAWSGQAFLTSDDVTFSFGFGWSVSISGDTALVGTHPGYAAFVFTRNGRGCPARC